MRDDKRRQGDVNLRRENITKQGGNSFMAQPVDPVCGMQIEEEDAAGQAEHEGTTYYFCSTACQRKFEANPAEFTN
ncbi:MAG: YHS domain-containing protein [Acidobacteriota bacterium]|nr:YHS domain-containing protein [Acidobacteriota bacterium]